MSKSALMWALVAPLLAQATLCAQEKTIEERFKEMQARYEGRISALENEVRDLRARTGHGHDDHSHAVEDAIAALESHGHPGAGDAAHFHGGAQHVLDVSMALLFAAGSSTERDASLQTLQAGAHDPRRRGFTFQQAELSLIGAVDSCFLAEADIVFQVDPIEGETEVEVEEAFITTTFLPRGWNVEGGFTFTEFGIINPQHPERWAFLDQPVVHSRLFGGDGMRQLGTRVSWRAPAPWCCELRASVQNPNGETMTSFLANDETFEERAIGGRPFVHDDVRDLSDLVYLVATSNEFNVGRATRVGIGASAAFGPNATGPDGFTWIYGADLVVEWRRSRRSPRPIVTWQSELIFRDYRADEFQSEGDPLDPLDDVFLPGDTLHDWGFYTQLLWEFAPRWSGGVRWDHAASSGDDYDAETGSPSSTADDPFRDDRDRFSALLTYRPSSFSRIRLQYNFDRAEHLDSDAHSLWFGVEFVFGHHARHQH